MTISIILIVASLLFVSMLMAMWRYRLRLIAVTFILGSIYLLATSDVFLVIRVPTICVSGLAILLGIMIILPTNHPPKPRKARRFNSTGNV